MNKETNNRAESSLVTADINSDMTSPTAKNGGRKFKNDIFFIIILLSAVCAVGACFYFLRPEGASVEVRINGTLTAEYPLDRDITVELAGEGGVNRLVIRDGEAYVEYADCPDGICSAHAPISRSGESIACLPHRLIITVTDGDADPDAPDVVA